MHTRRERHGDYGSSHGIDLAPMLDFVVNLLIFFIVAAVFVRESAVTVKRPTNTGGTESIVDSIEIHDDGEIVIGGRVVAVVDQVRHGGIDDITFTTTR